MDLPSALSSLLAEFAEARGIAAVVALGVAGVPMGTAYLMNRIFHWLPTRWRRSFQPSLVGAGSTAGNYDAGC